MPYIKVKHLCFFNGGLLAGGNVPEHGKDCPIGGFYMFADQTKLYVKAGDGGDGAVAFHREKYVVPTAATAARAAISSFRLTQT